jgi:hypothetical protein
LDNFPHVVWGCWRAQAFLLFKCKTPQPHISPNTVGGSSLQNRP